MPIKVSYNLKVGFFIFISFVLFVAAILVLGQKQNLFQQTIKVSSVFSDVRGLQVGDNVRFTGIQVGTIVSISILADTAVNVVLAINKSVVPYVKKDSRATIGTEGLMGNTVVILFPGTPGTSSIEPGDQLPAINPVDIDDIIKEIKISSEKISGVANNLIEITEKINRGDGIFGKLFTDSDLTAQIDQTGKNIATLTQNLSDLLQKINTGQGVVGKLFVDTTFAHQLDTTIQNVTQISENLEDFSKKVNEGVGILGNLFADTTRTNDFIKVSENLQTTLQNLSEISSKLNDKNNALNKFIADSAFADSVEVMMTNLNKGIVEVTQASEAVQRSGFVRAFSKKDKKNKNKKSGEN
jgi:phospholipid/cholesterol/gamma-HCH transport system substrate-binding protein